VETRLLVLMLVARRGGAGDVATHPDLAEAAVGQAGQGRRDRGDADIPPLSPADLPQGPKAAPPRQREFLADPQGLWGSKEKGPNRGKTLQRCRKGSKASARERLLTVIKREGERPAQTKG